MISRTGKHALLIAVLVLVLGTLFAGGSSVKAQQETNEPAERPSFQAPEEAEFLPGEIIVKLEEDASRQDLVALNRRNDARIEKDLPLPDTSVVDLPPELPVQAAAQRYEASPAVEYAEPNFRVFPTRIPNDERYPEMWNLSNTGQTGGTRDADIDANLGWEVTTGNPDTVVAVIDTGTQIEHPDLQGNIWENPNPDVNMNDTNGWDFCNGDNTVYDSPEVDIHGTHVAGTLAATGNNNLGVAGVAWQADIMPLKFMCQQPDDPVNGSVSDAISALKYAVDKGARISNNSWGFTRMRSDPPQALCDAIADAGDQGHLFVAAAGNSGANNDGTQADYPASCETRSGGAEITNIISVAATNYNDRLAAFSNYGESSVDLVAPGVNILSTIPGNEYSNLHGTSMAAPQVAGTAALLKSRDPGLSDEEIKRQILRTVEKKRSLRGKTVTGGRLNAAAALDVGPTLLTSGVAPRVTVFRSATAVSGSLATLSGRPLVGRKVVIQGRPLGSENFRKFGETTTSSNGTYILRGVRPYRHTHFRAVFNGNPADGLESTISPVRRVDVRARVTLEADGSQLKVGQRRAISGRVFPNHRNSVDATIKRNGKVIERRRVLLDNRSRYRFVYRPRTPGRYAFFVTFPGDRDHLPNRSPQKSFRVVR